MAKFKDKKIRKIWVEKEEKWYFSVIDIVGALTESISPRKYWNKLSQRLNEEGSESVTKCLQLKLLASDGKKYLTDVADLEVIFRIIQTVPSPNAEPLKLWLARVGYERIEEINDPELSINRAMQTYLKKGYSKDWINQRLKSIEVRKGLTDEWLDRGVKQGYEFAILTDDITKAWSDMTVREFKNKRGLKKQSLRDHMTNMELILTMLAEATTTEISKVKEPDGFEESRDIAKEGGEIAGITRKEIEKKTGKKLIS